MRSKIWLSPISANKFCAIMRDAARHLVFVFLFSDKFYEINRQICSFVIEYIFGEL